MIKDFPGKNHDETIQMVIRKHPIVYLRLLVIFLGLSIFPVTVFMMFWSNYFPLSSGSLAGVTGYLGACFYLLYSLAIFLIAWLNEEFDLFIITDQRLIDITQVNFFKRTVADTPLRNIEDAVTDIHGIFATLLNYGILDIQTAAGNASDFVIDHIPDPVLMAREIMNIVRENQKKNLMHLSSHIEQKKNEV